MKKFLKGLKWFFTVTILLAIGSGIGAFIFFYPKLSTLYLDAAQKVNNIKEDTFKSAQTSLVYDSDNNIIAKLKGEKDVYYLGIDDITDFTKYAFIATEDKNFLTHKGIDIRGIMRAGVNLVKNQAISGGGSTITQQLSRNIFLTHEVSFERKIKEIFISILLEKNYSKEEILEYYINSIYFSNGVYGIEAASKKFFSKSSSELTLAETVFLCAIPNNPTLYNPITNYDNTIKRQVRMLGYMLEDGYITQEEYDEALAEKIVLNVESSMKNNYVDTYVIHSATEALMEMKGFEFRADFKNDRDKENYNEVYNEMYADSQKELYTGGYRIYTSIDMKKQSELQKALDNELKNFTSKAENGIYEFQGAATAIDNTTGKVVAIVGGRSQDVSGYTLNRAFQSYRQPGSTFKPLVVYTPIFEKKGYLPSTLVDDTKSADGPQNYNGKYDGMITIRQAVQQSKNTIAWNLLNEIGPKKGLSYVKKMGFKKIVDSDNNLSSALGGLTYGASTLEMASAYSAIARDGYFYKPTCIVKITDANDNVLYNDTQAPVQVYTTKASRIMTNVLQSVMEGGTGAALKLNNMPSAGKTGSTNDLKDGWFAGYTKYYTTVVWCGYDNPKPVTGLYGSSYPGRIWKNFMNAIHKNLKYAKFAEYDGLKAEEAALSEAVKAEEERKVLIDEIDTQLAIYMNKEINSLSDVTALEEIYNLLIEKINKLTNKEEQDGYLNKIKERQSIISSKKDSLISAENESKPEETPGDVIPPNDGTNNGDSSNGGTTTPETPENPETPQIPETSNPENIETPQS